MAHIYCEQSIFTNNVSWLGDPRLKKGREVLCINHANFQSFIFGHKISYKLILPI
ncbi:hypothetical protein IFVP203_C210257 [Vibrio parahaemolyticus]